MEEAGRHDDCAPPRPVDSRTQVAGHSIRGQAGQRAFCECGERQSPGDDESADAWRATHLRDAWPVLVPKLKSEPLEVWVERIAAALAISDETSNGPDRAMILTHQLHDVQATIIERSMIWR